MALNNLVINVELSVHDVWMAGKTVYVLVEVKIESLEPQLILMEGTAANV